MGKVPAIRHGDVVVTEAAAICAYLADAFPQAGLAPEPGSRLRGPYYRWLFFAAGPLEAAVTNKALGFLAPDGRGQAMVGYGSYEAVMDALEGAVSRGDYLVGDRFTAADLYVGAHLGWGLHVRHASTSGRPSSATPRASRRARPRSAPTRSTTRSCPTSRRGGLDLRRAIPAPCGEGRVAKPTRGDRAPPGAYPQSDPRQGGREGPRRRAFYLAAAVVDALRGTLSRNAANSWA